MTNNDTIAKPYNVTLWGSDPEDENDDCWMGVDFATKSEALAAYASPRTTFPTQTLEEGEFVQVDGPDVHEARPIVRGEWHQQRGQPDSLWARERMWQECMLGGCD